MPLGEKHVDIETQLDELARANRKYLRRGDVDAALSSSKHQHRHRSIMDNTSQLGGKLLRKERGQCSFVHRSLSPPSSSVDTKPRETKRKHSSVFAPHEYYEDQTASEGHSGTQDLRTCFEKMKQK